MTEYDFLKKEEKEETKTELSKPDDTKKNDNEVKPTKYVLVTKEGIRERKRQSTPTQDNPEPVNQPLPSLTVDVAIDKFTEIRNKIVKFYNEYPKQAIAIGLIIIIAFIYARSSGGKSSPFFEKFAGTTKTVFEEINNVELPASNTIMEHTVAVRNVANMIKHSPAFGDHGSQISSGLLKFGEKIMVAGRNLQNMYNKGSSAYKSFDIEIKAMKERLNSNRRQGDSKFFKDRINKLITNIQEFRKSVGKAQSSIIDAEVIRHDAEGYIIDGLRDAEKFVSNNQQHAVELVNSKKELKSVNNVLEHLHNTAGHLDKMNKILMTYEDRLLDVQAALDNTGDAGDDIFEVTNEDLSYLKYAVDKSKACLYKFNQLSAY